MPSVSVRYIVDDIDEAITFYADRLGFTVDLHPAPDVAMLSQGELRLVLSSPRGSGGGAQPMPDGRTPQPGGWNRIMLEREDLEAEVAHLREEGAHFRSELVTGVGARQILLEDPSGNPIELFELLEG